jgi:hypothetical protein
VSRARAVRTGVLLRIMMNNTALLPTANCCDLSCSLKPMEVRPRIYAIMGFEAAMISPSGASWHIGSSLFKFNFRKSTIQRIKDIPSGQLLFGVSRVVRGLIEATGMFCCCARCAKARGANPLWLSFVDGSFPCRNSNTLEVLPHCQHHSTTLIVLRSRVFLFSLRPSSYHIIQCLCKLFPKRAIGRVQSRERPLHSFDSSEPSRELLIDIAYGSSIYSQLATYAFDHVGSKVTSSEQS